MITIYNGLNESLSNISVLVCHGSMQTKFDQFHPLVQFYQKHFKNVYSLELPGHGNQRQFDDISALYIQDILNILYKEIDSTCPTENLFVTTYSVSGLLFMKMWERLYNRNKDLKGIFIGTAIKIRSETSSLIRRFFSEEMYIRLGWENIMIRQHGPNWKKTIRLINTWFQEDSSIFPNEQEIEFLIQQDKENNIQFIIGKQDQPFKKEDIIRQHNFSVIEIEGDHFSYFVIKKSWPLVKKIIEEKLFYWFNLNLK